MIPLVLLVVFAVAGGNNWPEFRGPSGQGLVSGSLPTVWNTTKNVVWKQPIPGRGWSSPIVWEQRIYLTTAVPGVGDKVDQSLRALCLDAVTGKIIWDHEVISQIGEGAPKLHRKNGHASPTPLTDGQRLYVHFGHQGTAALDLSGQVLWQRTDLKYVPAYGNAGSPALVNGLLVFSCDGEDQQYVIALDAQTGSTRWKSDRQIKQSDPYSFSTPLAIEVNGAPQIVSPAAGGIMSYDPRTGQEIWRVTCPPDCYSNVPRPLYGHGLIYVSDSADNPTLLAIRADGKGDVTSTHVAWRDGRALGLTASPILVGDELYAVSDQGVASCLDAKSGKIIWRHRIGGDYSASPIHADGKLYFQNEAGIGTVIRAGREYQLISKNDLEEPVLASYAAANGALFIRTEKHLYRIEERGP